MVNLFESSPLQQDTGLLSERWGQEDSDILTLYSSVTSSGTVQTVTAGKVMYIKNVFLECKTGVAVFIIQDAAVSKVTLEMAGGDRQMLVFDVPLRFDTSLAVSITSGKQIYATFTGWEE